VLFALGRAPNFYEIHPKSEKHKKPPLFRYNSGYFYNINSMFACPLIKDLVQKFGGENGYFEAKDEAIINATFYFSHSEAVLPFLRLLNLYRYGCTHKFQQEIFTIFRPWPIP
jgi:hypothetical protein